MSTERLSELATGDKANDRLSDFWRGCMNLHTPGSHQSSLNKGQGVTKWQDKVTIGIFCSANTFITYPFRGGSKKWSDKFSRHFRPFFHIWPFWEEFFFINIFWDQLSPQGVHGGHSVKKVIWPIFRHCRPFKKKFWFWRCLGGVRGVMVLKKSDRTVLRRFFSHLLLFCHQLPLWWQKSDLSNFLAF